MVCAWDRLLARRAVTIGATVSLLIVLVVATTDEGASWGRRAAMCAALAPVSGSLGALAAVRIAHARGEIGALLAIGVSPSRAVLGAMAGGATLALAGACITAFGWADLSALLPPAAPKQNWVLDASGILQEPALAIALGPGAQMHLLPADASALLHPPPPQAAGSTSLALAVSAIACPVWTLLASGPVRKAIAGLFALAAMLIGFHLVGAARANPLVLVLPPLALLADALAARYHAERTR